MPVVRPSANGAESSANTPAPADWRTRWHAAATSCRRWMRRRGPGRPRPEDGAESLAPLLAELRSQFLHLAAAAEALPALAADIERRFLDLGSNLEKLPEASDDLVRQSENLLRLASGRGEGESLLQSTASRLDTPLRFIDRFGEISQNLHDQLQNTLRGIDRMLHEEGNLNRTVAPLKFIRTLFKVESAPLDHSIQTMFLALTEDISALQRQVSDTFGEKFQLLRETRQTIATVIQSIEDQTFARDRIVREKKAALAEVLNRLQLDLEANRQKDIRLSRVSSAISQEVGKLVFGLQAQDIVSQKLAHVQEALARLQEGHRTLESAVTPEAQAREAARFNRDARIQQAHLKAIQEDLAGTETQLAGAVAGIDREIGQLDNGCLALKEFDQVTAGVDGLVQVLLDTTAEVRSLLKSTVAEADRAYQAIRPLGGRTSNVTATMRQLSAQIRLIALNAQVQASQIASGTGLEVLAAATATVSVEAGSISESIASELDRFGTEINELVSAFAGIRDEGTAQDADWDARSAEDERALHAYRNETLAELERIAGSADRIRSLIETMRGRLDLQSAIGTRLQDPHDTLSAIIEVSVRMLRSPALAAIQATLDDDDPPHRYTMESERLVHEAAVAAARAATGLAPVVTATAATAAATAVAAVQQDATGDSAPAATDPTPGDPPAAATGNTGLAGHLTGLATPDRVEESGKGGEFGNNVDLF